MEITSNQSGVKLIPTYYQLHGLSHFSPSQLNKSMSSWFYEYVVKNEQWRRSKQPSAPMLAGNSFAVGYQAYLLENKHEDLAVRAAINDFKKQRKWLMGNPIQIENWEKCLDDMPDTVLNGIQALKDLGVKKYKDINCERNVDFYYDGVDVVTFGKIDVEVEPFFIEFKTKWSKRKKRPKKDEYYYQAVKCPTGIGQFEMNHAKQVSFYNIATNKKPGMIVYASASDYSILNSDSCDELTNDAHDENNKQLRHEALARQNILKISDDVNDIKKIITPNWKDINFYGYTNEELKEVKEFYYGS